MEDRFFKYAVIVSLILHLAILIKLQAAKAEKHVVEKKLELSYQFERPKPKTATPESYVQKIKDLEPVDPSAKVVVNAPEDISRSIFKSGPDLADSFKMYERAPDKVKGLKVTKEVSVPMLKSEKINTPSYVTYYQIVRDRIRDRAYNNYTKLSVGEVYLTFIIKSDGSLSELQILEGNSSANEFLRAVGMKSVGEAAPFPPFPQDLSYPELTFNVQISFQYREGE